ncbi:MAG TPA: hypothetical protein VG713_05460 [Pirellulales bacterium]|nr:hypothetical protein [Pirellulales bacterium]
MGTTVTYNGVTLQNVITRTWDQEVEYDQSGTDVLFTRYKLAFEGIMHVQGEVGSGTAPNIYSGNSGTTNAVTALNDISKRLWEPRRELVVNFGGVEALRVIGGYGTNGDVNNGPRPQRVSITHVASNRVFRVSFAIECATVFCADQTSTASGFILNNRWSISEEMDDDFFITRTIRGQLRLSTALVVAHAFKGACVPSLEPGFKRASLSYEVAADGLTCDYTVVDRQVHTSAPWPATSINGTHTESTDDGVTYASHLSVRLTGHAGADKRALIALAVAVADAKLNYSKTTVLAQEQKFTSLLTHCAIIDHIGDRNEVEVQMSLARYPDDPAAFLGNLASGKLGAPLSLNSPAGAPPLPNGPQYNPGISQEPNLFGYNPYGIARSNPGEDQAAALAVMQCYLQTPCGGNHGITLQPTQQQQSGSASENQKDYPTQVSGQIVTTLNTWTDPYYNNEEMQRAVYTMVRMESKYSVRPIRVQMPIARRLSDSSSSGSGGTPPDTCRFYALADAIAEREIWYEAERVGDWPQVPRPSDTYSDGQSSIQGTLLESTVTPRAPTISPNGQQKIFHVTSYCRYGLNRPPTDAEAINVGALPFTSFSQVDNSVMGNSIFNGDIGP